MPSENIISRFWELASNDETTRLKAASQLLDSLHEAQMHHEEKVEVEDNANDDDKNFCCDELEYSVKRLVKGLASSRKGARQGFATVLTEVLSKFVSLSPERVLKLIGENLEVTGSAISTEEKDRYIGQLFGMVSVLRSQCDHDKISTLDSNWLSPLISKVIELSKKKSYLQELCAKVIVDIFPLVSEDVFKNCVYPSVKEIFESGWTQATPETLLISLALQRFWEEHLDKKVIKVAWKSPLIADTQNYKQIYTVLQDSISSHPRVHCVWDEIFLAVCKNSPGDFEMFWNTVVEDGLFQSTHDRKFLGFQLVNKILPQLSEKEVSVVFGAHMMRSFINSLSSSQSYLHEAAKQLASSLPTLVKQSKDPGVPVVVLKQLLGRHGIMHFDKLTKTRTVDSLLGTLQGSGPQMFVAWLLDIFEKGNFEDSTESESLTKSEESSRIAVLNQLYQLVKKKSGAHEGNWLQDVLFFFLKHAYFQTVGKNKKETLPASVRQICEQRFVSALKDLSSSREMKSFELHDIVQHAKELLEHGEYKVASDLWTEEAEKAFKKAVHSIEKIRKKRRKSGESRHEDEVFELLFTHMALNLFTEPEQAMDILKELKACYERQKTKHEEKSDEEPHWVEVLTEVLLSLLTKTSSLFRHVVDQVFVLLAPHLTQNALNMILESLDTRKGINGESLEIVDESDIEEDDEEMEDDEEKGKEESNGVNGKGESGDDDDDEGVSSSDEEEENVGAVDEAFRAEVQAALGPAMVDVDKEGSSSDEDLDDEAMMRLDGALAAVFKSQLQAKRDISKKKDARKIILYFKLRVLDIIEILIKKQASNPLILELIIPLLNVTWSALNSKDFHTLGEKAQAIFQNKLCTAKELPPISAINAKDVHKKLENLIQKAMMAPSMAIVSLITRGCLYLVRVLRGSQTKQSVAVGMKKKEESCHEETAKLCLLNTKRVTAAFKKALEDFMLKRSTHLHPVLFTELIKRFPHLGWNLAADLVEYLETAVNNFRKSQACLMLLQLMSQKTPDHSTLIRNIAPSIQTTLNSVMTKVAESDSDVKIRHLREILKLTTKFINEVKNTEEAAAVLRIDQLKEGVTRIQGSALAKKSPDINGVCNAILSNLSRSSSEKETKMNNSRRKREANGHIKDETKTTGVGAESSPIGKEGKKKRKKKKI